MRILILTGEVSGDQHGAKLATALFQKMEASGENRGAVSIEGVGGESMEKAGVRLLSDIRGLGVVGLFEVLSHCGSIWRVYRTVKKRLSTHPPDLVILIDFPDFNLRMAKIARKKNLPVIYYISPQVWAWRSGRVSRMARLINKMLVIFPFEKPLYEQAGVDCEFVGHPLLDDLNHRLPREQLRLQFGMKSHGQTVGLFPGSRRHEILRHLPVMLAAMQRLRGTVSGLQLILCMPPSIEPEWIKSIVNSSHPGIHVHLSIGQPDDVIAASDVLVVASGTATLQAAIHETPMVIVYKVSWLTYLLSRFLIRTLFIGMVNIVAEKKVVPELIQSNMTSKMIEHEVCRILTDSGYMKEMKENLRHVREKLGTTGASIRAAQTVLDFMDKRLHHTATGVR